jgi:hypothetical protein
MSYGLVKKGEIKDVSPADGKAFIKNGIAMKIKGEKQDGNSISGNM